MPGFSGQQQSGHGALSVIVPCCNASATLKAALERVLASPFTGEVIVVDDGSDDGSADIARSFDDPRVQVIEHGRRLGGGSAVRLGLRHATCPFVVVQDADLDYAPEIYELLLEPLLRGDADVVCGSRLGRHPRRVMLFWQATAIRALTLLSNALTNLNMSDVMAVPKIFRREVAEQLDVEQDRYGVQPEIVAKCAVAGHRIFEVTIPYEGRAVVRGRRADWLEVLGSVYSILRYSSVGSRVAKPRARHEQTEGRSGFDDADVELASSLDSLDAAGNYADWIVTLIAPHLGDRTIEIGAGHGTMSARLRKVTKVTATELSHRAAAVLRERFRGDDEVEVVEGDVSAAMTQGPFDSAVMINVLEHIEDDVGVLREIHDGLRPGGTIAVFVPAFESLYSEFDRSIGHFRRYRRSTLAQALIESGFEVVDLRYFSLPGAFAWLVVARLLGRPPTSSGITTLYDRVGIPILRPIERRWRPPAGQSVLAIGRRPER